MNKTPAYYIFLGLLIGAIAGWIIGAWSGDVVHGLQLGAMAGLFIGWFLAAVVYEQQSKKK